MAITILDCQTDPIPDAPKLEMEIRAIPGVVGTGLFLGNGGYRPRRASGNLRLIEERRRGTH